MAAVVLATTWYWLTTGWWRQPHERRLCFGDHRMLFRLSAHAGLLFSFEHLYACRHCCYCYWSLKCSCLSRCHQNHCSVACRSCDFHGCILFSAVLYAFSCPCSSSSVPFSPSCPHLPKLVFHPLLTADAASASPDPHSNAAFPNLPTPTPHPPPSVGQPAHARLDHDSPATSRVICHAEHLPGRQGRARRAIRHSWPLAVPRTALRPAGRARASEAAAAPARGPYHGEQPCWAGPGQPAAASSARRCSRSPGVETQGWSAGQGTCGRWKPDGN